MPIERAWEQPCDPWGHGSARTGSQREWCRRMNSPIAEVDQGARRSGVNAALAEGLRPASAKMVLPVRIELTTSPFVTPALSCPLGRKLRQRSCAGPSLHREARDDCVSQKPGCRPSGLYTFLAGAWPEQAWLGIAVSWTGRFPRI